MIAEHEWWGYRHRPLIEAVIAHRTEMVRSRSKGDTAQALHAGSCAISAVGAAYSCATNRLNSQGDANESLGLKKVLTEALSADEGADLLRVPAVSALAEFRPLIASMRDATTQTHQAFSSSYEHFVEHGSRLRPTLECLAMVLYMVRSNAMHSQKPLPRHDDVERERNLSVARIASQSFDVVLNAALGFPSERLAVYGTLAPGESNHHLLERVRGTWANGSLRGHLSDWHGYPMFEWNTRGAVISCSMLSSKGLPAHWPGLDQFEGTAYERTWVTVDLDDGAWLVASCYERAVDKLSI